MQLELSMSKGNPEMLNHLIYFPEFITRTESKSPVINNLDTLTKIAKALACLILATAPWRSRKTEALSWYAVL